MQDIPKGLMARVRVTTKVVVAFRGQAAGAEAEACRSAGLGDGLQVQ